jgi:hypothetical protein
VIVAAEVTNRENAADAEIPDGEAEKEVLPLVAAM